MSDIPKTAWFVVGAAVLLLAAGWAQAGALRTGLWLLAGSAVVTWFVAWTIVRMIPFGSGAAEGDRAAGAPASLWVMVGVALVIRIVGLNEGLWFDEIRTLTEYLSAPVLYIVTTFDSQNQHMLYSLLARPFVWLFGPAAWTARMPALLFGVGSIWATWWCGRKVVTDRQAVLAAAFLALSYHHVWFSQNARGYTGLLFFTLVSTGFFLELLPGCARTRGVLAGYVAATALGVYTHATAAIVGVAHLVVWAGMVWRTPNPDAGRFLPAAGVVLAGLVSIMLYAIVLPQFLDTLLAPTMANYQTEWKNPIWLVTETVRGLAAGVPGGLLSVGVGALIFGAGLWSIGRERPSVAALLCLPGVLLVGVIIGLGHNLWPRLVLFSAGFGALIVMRGVAVVAETIFRERGAVVAMVASVALVAASAMTVPRAWGPKQDFAGAMAFVANQASPDDAVVTVDMAAVPYQEHLPAGFSAVDGLAQLSAIELESARVWLIYVFETRVAAVQPEIWAHLQTHYREAADFPGTVMDGEVVVMVRDERDEARE